MRQSQILQSEMYSSDAVLITQVLFCIDLANQLEILMRHNNLAVSCFMLYFHLQSKNNFHLIAVCHDSFEFY